MSLILLDRIHGIIMNYHLRDHLIIGSDIKYRLGILDRIIYRFRKTVTGLKDNRSVIIDYYVIDACLIFGRRAVIDFDRLKTFIYNYRISSNMLDLPKENGKQKDFNDKCQDERKDIMLSLHFIFPGMNLYPSFQTVMIYAGF